MSRLWEGRSIRMFDDEDLKALIDDVVERVSYRMREGKKPYQSDLEELLDIAATIPAERAYWRSVAQRRAEEAQEARDADERMRGRMMDLNIELDRYERDQKQAEERLKTKEAEIEHRLLDVEAERDELLKRLGEWAVSKGLGPGENGA